MIGRPTVVFGISHTQCSQELNSTQLDFASPYFIHPNCIGCIIDPIHHSGPSRGSHIRIACRSVCDRDQEFWLLKIVLDCLIAPLEALDPLILREFKGNKCTHTSLVLEKVRWSVDFSCSESSWSLDHLLKECLSLDSILIANTSIGDAYETTSWLSYYIPWHVDYVIICWCMKVDGDIKAAWSRRTQIIWPVVIHPLHALPSLVSGGQTKGSGHARRYLPI